MQAIQATVVRGHGVASGIAGDPRFPHGTLHMQFPIFARHGLDLSGFFPGTINLDIAPATYQILKPKLTLKNIHWHPDCPPETFSFFDCQLDGENALIYYPHPETKPEHFQSEGVLEIIGPKIKNLMYGQKLKLTPAREQFQINT